MSFLIKEPTFAKHFSPLYRNLILLFMIYFTCKKKCWWNISWLILTTLQVSTSNTVSILYFAVEEKVFWQLYHFWAEKKENMTKWQNIYYLIILLRHILTMEKYYYWCFCNQHREELLTMWWGHKKGVLNNKTEREGKKNIHGKIYHVDFS